MELKNVMFLLLFLSGCVLKSPNASNVGNVIIDDLGRKVEVPKTIQRVISLAPSLTEIVVELVGENKLVGRTEYCNYPQSVEKIPSIGSVISPSLEAIVAARPDIVFATADGNPRQVVEHLDRVSIPVLVFNSTNWKEILNCIETVGIVVGEKEKAEQLTQYMKGEIAQLLIPKKKKRVIIVLNRRPVISVAPGSFLDEMIRVAGGENAITSASSRYPTLSPESMLMLNPDVIMVTEMSSQPLIDTEGDLLNGFKTSKAVKNQAIFYIHPDLIVRPGPRIVLGLKQLNSYLSGN